MPVMPCSTGTGPNRRPGRKWGPQGNTCYPCTRDNSEPSGWDCSEAEQKAIAQGVAIGDIDPDG
jgi:hypothetical protein